MRLLTTLDKYRDRSREIAAWGHTTEFQDHTGFFRIPVKGLRKGLTVVASSGTMPHSEGWDHVSVSTPTRCPFWEEMSIIKDLFFFPEDVCFQLHPAKGENISNHRFCLHIWHHPGLPVPQPPAIMVGIAELGDQTRNKYAGVLVEKIWDENGM